MTTETTGLSIAALELETGIAKDTLRVWERRYGFPRPGRDAHGERVYPPEQVIQLRDIRRLLDQGLRPGQVLTLSAAEIAQKASPVVKDEVSDPLLVAMLKRHDEAELARELRLRLAREGLASFVLNKVPPMLTAVGQAWARSDLEVFEEHLFSEQLRSVLHEALAQLPPAGESPRVLLTTLPGEPHSLGLLLSQALLRLEGALCIFLGPQTPESQIVAAAEAYHADIVALSFSEYFPVAGMRDSIQRVRDGLPARVLLWCGGRSARRLRKPPEGVRLLAALSEIGEGISAWRAGATGASPADGAANDSDGRAAPALSGVDQGSDQGGSGQDANNQDGSDQRS